MYSELDVLTCHFVTALARNVLHTPALGLRPLVESTFIFFPPLHNKTQGQGNQTRRISINDGVGSTAKSYPKTATIRVTSRN